MSFSTFFLLYQNNIEGRCFSTLCLHSSGNPYYAVKDFSQPPNPVHSYLAGFWPRIILQYDHRDSFSFSLLFYYFLNCAARTKEEIECDIFLMWWKFIPAKNCLLKYWFSLSAVFLEHFSKNFGRVIWKLKGLHCPFEPTV